MHLRVKSLNETTCSNAHLCSKQVIVYNSGSFFFTRGVCLAILCGTLYGNVFVPTMYIQGWYKGASQEGRSTELLYAAYYRCYEMQWSVIAASACIKILTKKSIDSITHEPIRVQLERTFIMRHCISTGRAETYCLALASSSRIQC